MIFVSAMFDNIKITIGKQKLPLGNIASILNKDDKYVLDLTSSPNVRLLHLFFFLLLVLSLYIGFYLSIHSLKCLFVCWATVYLACLLLCVGSSLSLSLKVIFILLCCIIILLCCIIIIIIIIIVLLLYYFIVCWPILTSVFKSYFWPHVVLTLLNCQSHLGKKYTWLVKSIFGI